MIDSLHILMKILLKMRRINEEMSSGFLRNSNESRRFIKERIRQEEAEENLKQVIELLKRTKDGVEKGFAVAVVREDREGH